MMKAIITINIEHTGGDDYSAKVDISTNNQPTLESMIDANPTFLNDLVRHVLINGEGEEVLR